MYLLFNFFCNFIILLDICTKFFTGAFSHYSLYLIPSPAVGDGGRDMKNLKFQHRVLFII